jgi:glycine cleavage system H protein
MKKIKNFDVRTDLWYATEEGFWLDIDGRTARIGMSPLVQESTGSFVAVRFENLGTPLSKGASFGSLEAEKHVGHLKMPVSGVLIAVNDKVVENPRLLNTDPYGKGWLAEVELTGWPAEQPHLLSGEKEVEDWFAAEIEKYEDKGWLAES